MSVLVKCLLVFIVIFFHNFWLSSGLIHKIIAGSLGKKWEMSFRITIDSFEGIPLYCIDSEKNQFEIEVKRGKYDIKYITLKFNTINKYIPLKRLCLCDPCDNVPVGFYIKSNISTIEIWCSADAPVSLLIQYTGSNSLTKDSIRYSVPNLFNHNKSNIYLSIGYIWSDNLNNTSFNDNSLSTGEMTGCLDYFTYDHNKIQFEEDSSKLRSICSRKCTRNVCNGGLCKQGFADIVCDCAVTTYNGRFCNQALKPYSAIMDNSYQIINRRRNIFFKLTWSPILWNNFCLMEIVGGYEPIIVWNEGTMLLVNNILISMLNIEVVNFFTIDITDEYLSIKANNRKTMHLRFKLTSNGVINIGFTEQKSLCHDLLGSYDVLFDPMQTRRIRSNQQKSNYLLDNVTFSLPVTKNLSPTMRIIGSVVIVLSITMTLFTIIAICLKKRYSHKMARDVDPIEIRNHVVRPASITSSYYDFLNFSIKTQNAKQIRPILDKLAPPLPDRNHRTFGDNLSNILTSDIEDAYHHYVEMKSSNS